MPEKGNCKAAPLRASWGMGNILILYHSNSGNTRDMAVLVEQGARSVEGTNTRLRSVEEASLEDLYWMDGLAAGSPTNLGQASWQLKRFFDEACGEAWKRIDGKLGCAFSSAANFGGGQELTCMGILTIMMNYGMLTFGVPDGAGEHNSPHYGAVSVMAPESMGAKEQCRLLGRRLAEWVLVIFEGRQDLHPVSRRNRAR